jgi:hypothetical protein
MSISPAMTSRRRDDARRNVRRGGATPDRLDTPEAKVDEVDIPITDGAVGAIP